MLGLVYVSRVQGCPLDVSPTALHCARPTATTTLTVLGGNFGLAGTAVQLRSEATGAAWDCSTVVHVPGSEASAVVCTGVNATDSGTAPYWADVPGPALTFPGVVSHPADLIPCR